MGSSRAFGLRTGSAADATRLAGRRCWDLQSSDKVISTIHSSVYTSNRFRVATRGVLCALLLTVAWASEHARAGEHATRLSVAGRDFDPLRADIAAFGQASQDRQGRGLRLVQWRSELGQREVQRLRALGAVALQYYPSNAFLIWSDAAALEQIGNDPAVRWSGDFGPGLRSSADLLTPLEGPELISVHFYRNDGIQATLSAMAALGASLVADAPAQPDGRLHNAYLRIEPSRLTALTQIPEVIWVGRESIRPQAEDEITAVTLVGNPPSGGPPMPGYINYLNLLGLDGAGVIWGVSDEGVDLTHPEFDGRIASGYSFPGCLPGNGPGDDSNAGGHGTHVAGILGGSGAGLFADNAGFRYGMGVAPKVQIYAQNILCRGGTPTFPPEGGWQSLSKRAVEAGASGTNASFTTGEGTRHGYQSIERLFDVMVRDGNFDTASVPEPMAIVFSAGNSGPSVSTLTAPKEAKNVIVVGATLSPRVGDPDELVLGSSRGPTQDGRIAPTVVAPGADIASTRRLDGGSLCNLPEIPDTNGLYAYCSGTSMAAPHVSGLAALMVQWWRQQFAGTQPSPAMLKALLIEGAGDSQSVAAATPNPDEGFGRAMLPLMIRQGRTPWVVDQTQALDDSGDVHRYALAPIDDQLPVRVVLAWTDAPGAIGASPALVNDLDLQVQRGASLHRGNQNSLGAAADRVNNAERVFLEAAAAPLIVRVAAHQLPGDGVPYSGDETDQDYALLCHNCAPVAGYDVTEGVHSAAICAGQPASFSVPLLRLAPGLGAVSANLGTLPSGLSGSVSPPSLAGDGQFEVGISDTAGLPAGSYGFDLNLSESNFQLAQTLTLSVSEAAPAASSLSSPVGGVEVSSLRPLLRWSAPAQASSYRLELSTAANLANPLVDLQLTDTRFRPSANLQPQTQYYWRITGSNACGIGASSSGTFRTPAAPGSCPQGTRKMLLYRDTMEPPQPGWEPNPDDPINTWAISSQRASSPTRSWRVSDFGISADQNLDSPAVTLPPATERPVLSFSHWRNIERRNPELCWDGAVLDVLSAAGTATPIDVERFQQGRPQRRMAPSSPSPGRPAWCGQSDFVTSVVDLRGVAGQIRRFRFRLLSDASNGAEGWFVDDFQVHSCVLEDVLFRNGMGGEPR